MTKAHRTYIVAGLALAAAAVAFLVTRKVSQTTQPRSGKVSTSLSRVSPAVVPKAAPDVTYATADQIASMGYDV